MIKYKDWDTNFFGYKVGWVDLSIIDIDIDQLLSESQEYRLVYGFSDDKLKMNSKFNHVDTKIVWERTLIDNIVADADLVFFDIEKHSLDELFSLVFLSGKFSRFNLDVEFDRGEFKRLYREWINKSLKSPQCAVLVSYTDKTLEGFVTVDIKGDLAVIGLIAVNPFSQGKGVGKKLIENAINYAVNCKAVRIEVATQEENVPAMKLYQKAGFNILSKKYIYHLWNK